MKAFLVGLRARCRLGPRRCLLQVFVTQLLVGMLCPIALSQGQPSSTAPGPGASTEDLQKATQNPVASLISVPFQNNVDENIGPFARDKNTLNIQPVIPTQISHNWNLIPRIITPLIYQPFVSPGSPDLYAQRHLGTFGLGDIQPTFFFASTKPSKIIWGVGPALLIPTASDDSLGTGKWCAGPSIVALVQPGKFTIGALVSNLWSFAGSSSRADVNTMTLQYFVNYNMAKGWFFTSAPILNANWNAGSGNVWLVPIGGGIGRIFRIGNQPVNGSISAYYNVTRPDTLPSPTWQLRLQLALLYPKMPKPKK